jgi:hypothetical protein
MMDKIIDLGNGVMVAPSYWFTDEASTAQSSRYIVKTTDGGANWSWVLVEGPTTEYINEGSILSITNNIIVLICRHDATKHQYWMYKSLDQGATWSSVGEFNTTQIMTISGPCALRKFTSDTGKPYAVMYFPDKGNKRLYALYGRLDNGVDGGVGLFNINTITLLRQDTEILHYGDMLHYNNNMNARGVWPREAGSFPTDNEMIYVTSPTTQYNTVAALIDPVTIYDKLGIINFIAAWRGLVSNTTNDWGVVNGSSQVTTWKSIRPGPISQDFTATAGGIVLDGTGITFDGTKRLAHGTSTYWNFMSYSAQGEADLNYTIYARVKFGTAANPLTAYGLLGNNAGSASNKGSSFLYDDRAVVPATDRLSFTISKGTAGFIISFANDNVITPNVFHVIALEVDLSQATQNDKVKLWVDSVFISTTVAVYNTGVVTLPTFAMQIGSVGNNVLPFTGTIKDIVIQNVVDIASVRDNFMQALTDAT